MSEVYTDWIRPASQINLIVEEEILPCVRIQVTHHFFWWRGWLFPRAKKSQRSCSLAPLVPWPTELFSTDAPLSKSCLIYGDIFNQKSINLIPWQVDLHYIYCIVSCFLQIRSVRGVTGGLTPPLTPPSRPMPQSRRTRSLKASLSQVNFSEVSRFVVWTCFIIYTTKILSNQLVCKFSPITFKFPVTF